MREWIAEILVGDTVVWSAVGSLPSRNVALDVASFHGYQKLMFRIRKIDVDPTASWWRFNGTDATLSLAGTSPDAANFNPALRNNDFTVAGVFAPTTITKNHILVSKWDDTTPKRTWRILLKQAALAVVVSDDGTNASTLSQAAVLTVNTPTFFCARYTYSGAGAINGLSLNVNGVESSIANARGPIYSGTSDVIVADMVSAADSFYNGKAYWLAYWNRALTATEVANMYATTIPPWDVSGIVSLWNFNQNVLPTYTTEVGDYIFTVNGTPVRHTT